MIFEEFKKIVIDEAKNQNISDYELYYSTSESTSVSAFKHEINQFESSLDGGVCFRCIVNGKMGYASTEELSEEAAKSVVSRALDNALALESEETEFLGEGGNSYKEVSKPEYDLPSTDLLVKTALAGQDALYSADPAVIDGSETQAVSESSTVAIVNSKGLDIRYENKASVLVLSAVVSDGDEMSDSYEIKAGELSALDIPEIAGKAVSDAKSKLKADVAPTGSYPVIFAPPAMSALLGTYASVFSSEAAAKGLSKLAGKEGKLIASEEVTLVDDPFYKDSIMPASFDDEGSPTYTKNVIENGVLNTLLYNLKTAHAAGRETTGNAAKSSYDSKVGIRPFTMYLAPGDLTEEELIKKAGNGVYIDSLGGLHAGANVISGDFSLQSEGFMIENGVKTKAVKSFTVAGNFYELLKQITDVSNEVKLRGIGGKTAFASPAVLCSGLSIAGK